MEKLECELDAGMQVTVQDVSSAVKHISPFWPMGWPEILHRQGPGLQRVTVASPRSARTLFGASDATWGHLAKPRGWILLHEARVLELSEASAVNCTRRVRSAVISWCQRKRRRCPPSTHTHSFFRPFH